LSLKSALLATHHPLFRNLGAGLRLALFGRPQPAATLGQLLVLCVLAWAGAAIADWQGISGAVRWSAWGVASEAARSYFWLGAVAVILALTGRTARFLSLAVALAAADVVLWAVWNVVLWGWPRFGAASYEHYGDHLWWVFLAWQVAIFARAFATACRDVGAPRAIAATAIYAGALYASLNFLPDSPLLDSAREDGATALNIEDTYYGQAELLTRAMADVAPGEPGRRDLFFVAFGAFGAEDVFRREVVQVSRIMAERFGTGPRTVQLINNVASVTRRPLANLPNLRYVLNSLAARMQRDEDVLVLFLTSHGAQDGTFAVELGDLGLNPMRPAALRAALDEAGIRWRIVIVSSCYSGRFVDALASPGTLLITAAAADRSSFGCAHENRWTYFGAAYFRDALAQTRSFVDAFERARTAIAARERREGRTPSKPQIVVGREIAPVLAELARSGQ
jgi:hypothetical protein